MLQIGSQVRDTLEDAGYFLDCRLNADEVVLSALDFTGKRELWREQDDFAGYVIEIDGKGYTFQRNLTVADFRELLVENREDVAA